MYKHLWKWFLILSLAYGCSKAAVQEPLLLYPLPPDEPRIKYVRTYRGEIDFVKGGFFDIIFGRPAAPRLRKPYGVTARGDKIYVTQTGGASVAVIDTKAQKVSYIGDMGSTGRLSMPIGVAVAPSGMLIVSDSKLKRVFVYDEAGNFKGAIGKKDDFEAPSGIAINPELGRVYIADSYGHRVGVYTLQGEALFKFGRRGHDNAEFNFPTSIAIDKRNGEVYVVDTQNFRVQVFDKDGRFLRKFGSVGDTPGSFARPKGIGIDSEGHVYVADAAFDNFQVFDETGRLLLPIGAAGSRPGYFQLPAGVYVDENDRIYVVDQLNNRVQVFQYLSEKWKRDNSEEFEKLQFNLDTK